MRVVVAGIGYVGVVSAACLARDGHQVVAVDVNSRKVEDLQKGRTPIVEPGLAQLISEVTQSGLLTASGDLREAVRSSDVTLVCVGTPSRANGDLDTSFLEQVTREVGEALRDASRPHTVVYRSTMLPGTTEDLLVPLLEKHAGRPIGDGLGVCVNPEFLREGSAIDDYRRPAKTVVGGAEEAAARVVEMYAGIDAPVFVVSIRHAEMTKYIDNSWHALKVAFANEVGSFCRAVGLDSHVVMETFLVDTNLNISTAYLKPGFAFGGSCLPKDLRAMNHRARSLDIEVPLLQAVLPSNMAHLDRVKRLISSEDVKRVGLLGLAFKTGTDDLRESPAVLLAEWLLGKGYAVSIFDQSLSLPALTGANLHDILSRVPHIADLLQPSPETVIENSDLVVMSSLAGVETPSVRSALSGRKVLDLVHAPWGIGEPNIVGVCW